MVELVYNITTKASEDYENFIFETIKPFCEEVMQQKISKQDLIYALSNAKPKPIQIVEGHDICPSCHLDITDSVRGMFECYCKRCGQHITRRWNDE